MKGGSLGAGSCSEMLEGGMVLAEVRVAEVAERREEKVI